MSPTNIACTKINNKPILLLFIIIISCLYKELVLPLHCTWNNSAWLHLSNKNQCLSVWMWFESDSDFRNSIKLFKSFSDQSSSLKQLALIVLCAALKTKTSVWKLIRREAKSVEILCSGETDSMKLNPQYTEWSFKVLYIELRCSRLPPFEH